MCNGFEQAQAEYESQMMCPYEDALFDWEAYEEENERFAEMEAERFLDENF